VSRHRTHRKDETQDEIVNALRAAKVLVWPIGRPSDLLCRVRGVLVLLDCARGAGSRKRDHRQLDTFSAWAVKVVATPEEALRAVGLLA
jgi:hypothetical protein